MAKKLKGDALLKACADKFAAAVSSAADSSGFLIDACNAAVEWFGGADVTVKQLSGFADAVCDSAGISDDTEKRKAPRSRYRKIARHRIALPGIVEAVRGDNRFDGKFSLHEGLKVATILNKEPGMTVRKCVNAYYNKKAAAANVSLPKQLQNICNKVVDLKGVRKGTPNGVLVAALIKAFETAEYEV